MTEIATAKLKQKKATIYDLADVTGFSSGTVSRVLNNRANVAPNTREKILRAAKELNLKPQLAARTRQVAIISDSQNEGSEGEYTLKLTSHLAQALSKKGVAVLFPSNPKAELQHLFLDGVISLNSGSGTQGFLDELETRIPIVYMDKIDCGESQYSVCSDHYQSGKLAAEYLAARGKRSLAFFAQDTLPYRETLRGYRDAMQELKLEEDSFRLVLESRASHMSAITRIVRSGADSVFIPGMSYQVLECLHLLTYVMGVRIPEDLSVIGGENVGLSELMNPPLTTLKEPLKQMAETAIETLETLMEGGEPDERQQFLPVSLIERNSVMSS